MDNTELWKPIEQFLYLEVSSKGRIKRLAHKNKKERIQSEFAKDRDGYCRCTVYKLDGTYTSIPVHRLVAMAFLPNPENKSQVNHKDGNRANNCIENLEWVTPKENVRHSYLYGNRKACKQITKNTLLTDFQINEIDNLRKYYTVNQIAKLFNVEYQSLKNVIHKKKHNQKLDNQQPSLYNSIYQEGSTTISEESRN